MFSKSSNKYEKLKDKDKDIDQKKEDKKYLEFFYGCFKEKYSFDERINQSTEMLEKYNYQRVPVLVEFEKSFPKKYVSQVSKRKYLVPLDFPFNQFLSLIRKTLKLPPKYATTLLVNNSMCRASDHFETLYHKNKDKDEFLYICVCLDSTFG